jgi:hypothetical protein
MPKEIGDLYNIKSPVSIICDNKTYLFGNFQDKIIIGMANENKSNNTFILTI